MTDNQEILRLRRVKRVKDAASQRAHYARNWQGSIELVQAMRYIRAAELAAVAAHGYWPAVARQPIQARRETGLGLAVAGRLLD